MPSLARLYYKLVILGTQASRLHIAGETPAFLLKDQKPSIPPTLHWANFNHIEKAFLELAEKKFLERCPEVPLEKIPNDHRIKFMENYEKLRPQLDGQDVIMISDEDEITALRKTGYDIEKEEEIIFEPDIVLWVIRIKDSKNIYLQICQSYCSSFISSFLKSVEEKQ
jgi:hypothetical protein